MIPELEQTIKADSAGGFNGLSLHDCYIWNIWNCINDDSGEEI